MITADFKPLFRSTTQVLIPQELTAGVLTAIEMLGGKKILLLADKNIREIPSFLKMEAAVKNSGLEVSSHLIEAKEPDVVWVDEQVAAVKDFQPHIVLGIGGGSLIDLAKAVSVLIYNDGPAASYQGSNLIKKPGAKKIMIPTTAGTGSEVTPGAVVVNREIGRKGAIGSPFITPDIAILEPSLALTMPPMITAATALDAMTHCLESYVGRAFNPFARMYAREGFRYLANAFPSVLAQPQDLESKLQMLIGSCMGGFAIFNTDTGACHSMSYPLGTYHEIPHGLANALMIPLVMEHNINQGCHRYADLYDLISDRDLSLIGAEQKSRALLSWLRSLLAKTALPKNFDGYDLTRKDIPDLAEKGLNLKTALHNNPVPFDYEAAVKVLEILVP
jgi:alcohol dehydrogenase